MTETQLTELWGKCLGIIRDNVPGTAFNCDTEALSDSFRLNYSTPSDEQIIEGVKRLGEVFAEL